MNEEIIEYLKRWRDRCSYEQIAMSEAVFSAFLDGLIEILEPTKPES